MTDKERLQDIKNKAFKRRVHVTPKGKGVCYWTETYELLKSDFEWLIEQAERYHETFSEFQTARNKVENIYVAKHCRNMNEYDGGYLDGLDRAASIYDKLLEDSK